MQTFIHRYAVLLLTGTLLIGAALPQGSTSAKSLEKIRAEAVIAQAAFQGQTDASTESLPANVARRVKQDIAKTFNIPVAQLQVSAAQPRIWDGCLGLPDPLAFCTKIAISGWQVIVTGQQRSWVYHTNETGSQVRLNQAASLTKPSQIRLSFLPEDGVPAPEEAVVFQSIAQGGISGRTTITKLTAAGIVTRQIIAPNIRSRPVIIKRITPEQVKNFGDRVRQQRFDHLNRLRYLPDRGADFETTKLSAGNVVVESATVQEQLPSGLQQVIQLWQTLLRS